MAKLSRTEKYRELRESLQNDVGQDLDTRDLDGFKNRLNQAAPGNFEAPTTRTNSAANHDPIHARRVQQVVSERKDEAPVTEDTIDMSLRFDQSSFLGAQKEPSFSNEYLDRYINEVKQYNIEQGNAVSDNTSVNILSNLREEQRNNTRPTTPYPKETEKARNVGTAEVPFVYSNGTPAPVRREPEFQENSLRQIANEVQSLVDTDQFEEVETAAPKPEKVDHVSNMSTSDFNRHLEMERTTRQQILNETTQMRTQLDDYEDSLNDFSDRMRHTNQILNIVLIVLILALLVVLGLVIYWIMH